jgi:uncharacterized membrane protein
MPVPGRRGEHTSALFFGINCLSHAAFTNSIALPTGFCYSPRKFEPLGGAFMAFCKACGQDAGDASFCPKCGAAQGTVGGAAPSAAVASPSSSAAEYPTASIEENVAGLLCYVFGWLTGLIFLLIDRRPFVKFHGAQSIAFNICIIPIWFALWIVWLILLHVPIIGLLGVVIFPIFGLAVFATWIFLMYKAYSHEKFKLPIIGDIVDKMVNK